MPKIVPNMCQVLVYIFNKARTEIIALCCFCYMISSGIEPATPRISNQTARLHTEKIQAVYKALTQSWHMIRPTRDDIFTRAKFW